jgi:hypothetical protein
MADPKPAHRRRPAPASGHRGNAMPEPTVPRRVRSVAVPRSDPKTPRAYGVPEPPCRPDLTFIASSQAASLSRPGLGRALRVEVSYYGFGISSIMRG